MANDQEEIKCFRKTFWLLYGNNLAAFCWQQFHNNNKKKFVNNCCHDKSAFSFCMATISQQLAGNNLTTIIRTSLSTIVVMRNPHFCFVWQQSRNNWLATIWQQANPGFNFNPAAIWQHSHNNDVWQQILHGNNQLPK